MAWSFELTSEITRLYFHCLVSVHQQVKGKPHNICSHTGYHSMCDTEAIVIIRCPPVILTPASPDVSLSYT